MGSLEKKKRVRVSKNRKRNWNKHCDVKDVEEFLEEKRFDERIGGAVSEKSDLELFCIETHAEPQVQTKKGVKKLKCFEYIGAYSKVPALHNRTQQRYSKRIKNAITLADEKRKKRYLANDSKEKKKEIKKNIQVGDMFSAELEDLWGEEKDEVDPDIKDLITFRDEYTCKKGPKVPGHRFQKPSLLPSVEVPHSGASYNPDFESHQNLLREAVLIEEAKLKQELHLKRVLTDMFPTKAEAPTQESILKEMSQGLFDESNSEEEEDEDSSLYSRNPPTTHEKRITKARKRRKRERKEEERLRLVAKLQKKRLNEVFRIKSLKSEIVKEAADVQKKVERNLGRKIDKMYKPRTLSKHKYEAPDLEVNLSEEISGSLRTLRTEGNLLEDRYKSLQRRNLIEPRIRQARKRKYKLKVQVKRNHRDLLVGEKGRTNLRRNQRNFK